LKSAHVIVFLPYHKQSQFGFCREIETLLYPYTNRFKDMFLKKNEEEPPTKKHKIDFISSVAPTKTEQDLLELIFVSRKKGKQNK